MAEGATWKWDLEEMRHAASMDPQSAKQRSDMVSGFTPINAPGCSPAQLTQERHVGDVDEMRSKTKAKAPKKRKTQPSTSAQKRKPGKTAGPETTKKRRTADALKTQDISKDLPRTKPAFHANLAPPSKTATLSDLTLMNAVPDRVWNAQGYAENEQDINLQHDDDSQRFPSRSRANDLGNDVATSMLPFRPLVGVAIEAAVNEARQPMTVVKDPDIVLGSTTQYKEWADMASNPFVTPPSAQNEHEGSLAKCPNKLNLKDHVQSIHSYGFNSDDIFSDAAESDEVPMTDDDVEEIIRSTLPDTEGGYLLAGWQPQALDDNPSEFDDSYEVSRLVSVPGCWEPPEVDESLIFALSDTITPAPSPILGPQQPHGFAEKPKKRAEAGQIKPLESEVPDDFFDDDDLDEDLLNMTARASEGVQLRTPLTSPEKPSSPKLQWMPPQTYESRKSLQKSFTETDTHGVVPADKHGDILPFTRPPFHQSIRDRSPILGLTNRTVLRTCFRIGEALNAAAIASRTNTDAIIELYARVIMSEREESPGFKQSFQFGDLFTDKPPYLSGVYNLWKGVVLWNVDSRVFVGQKGKGKMARVVGRIKRTAQGGKCELVVLSIWEVDWEDVEVAKGIVCS